MIQAAKVFTGSFAAGRDRIGYDNFQPTDLYRFGANYRTFRRFSDTRTDSVPLTALSIPSTAMAVRARPRPCRIAYNELYKQALPGALNILMLETDGLPNTGTYNFWDGSAAGIADASGCKDSANLTPASNGWKTAASMRDWDGTGYSMNSGGTGFMSNIPAGAIGAFYSSDPGSKSFNVLYYPWQAGDTGNTNSTDVTNASGCKFSGGVTNTYSDFAWLPSADVYGNQVNPANAYQSLTLTGGHVALSGTVNTDWTESPCRRLESRRQLGLQGSHERHPAGICFCYRAGRERQQSAGPGSVAKDDQRSQRRPIQ